MSVAVAAPFLAAFMAIDANDGGDLQLDQLLQAMAGQLRETRLPTPYKCWSQER